MNLLPGVSARTVETSRLRTHLYESGSEDGVPVLMLHGNLSTGRFFEHLFPNAPDRYRLIAPDMRSFGRSEPAPLDATRGLRDWADDTRALVDALGIDRPVHLVGWSTAGAAIANYAVDHGGVASLTFIDPVSPYGFGGCGRDGTPHTADWAGTGGGGVAPDFVAALTAQDRGAENPFSIRNIMNSSYWRSDHREPAEREDVLVDEVLLTVLGDDGYPGDFTPSDNWPGIAPGTKGILNALSGKYCHWADLVDVDPKPPVLWTHGTADIVIADASAWDMGTLGQMGAVPGWPGEDAFAPQPMVTQIGDVLESYRAAGGRVEIEMFEGSGHGPHVDAADAWSARFFGFLDSVE